MSNKKPIRIQRSRQHKQVSPNGLPIVYVGRPSKWGNPFKVGDKVPHIFSARGKRLLGDAYDVVDYYENWLRYGIHEINMDELRRELKGKNLSCWCKIGEPCHADILLKLANKE